MDLKSQLEGKFGDEMTGTTLVSSSVDAFIQNVENTRSQRHRLLNEVHI